MEETVMIETVTIARSEYEELREASSILDRLYAAGVDNWEGYSEAFEE